jgi:hypothetical protein
VRRSFQGSRALALLDYIDEERLQVVSVIEEKRGGPMLVSHEPNGVGEN